ncbi:hypothetical protein [Microbulbifer epialgicus]|uniref:LysM domain-containing protein n=1 Tax=Microbulbifer epialgicus TaxID=393907 RepID=A0ABV4P219_9GAMM
MVAVISGETLGLFNSTQAGVGSASFGQGRESIYVNASTGNLVLRQQDEFVAASGLDLSLLRTYNSQGQLDGDNNDGFRFNFSNQLINLVGTPNQPGSQIARIGSDGAETVYRYDASLQAYVSSDGAGAHDQILFDSGNNQWVWREGSSRVEEVYGSINGNWKLVAHVDAEGRQVVFGHNSSGLVDTVTDAAGQTLAITYSGTRVTGVTVSSDGTTEQRLYYSYDAQGRLETVTVDLSPQDSSIADGNVYTTTYEYDGDSTRVAAVLQSDGTVIRFVYANVDGQGDYRVTEVHTGRVTSSGLAQEFDNSDRRITLYNYDLAKRKTTITQVNNPEAGGGSWAGVQTELTFDSAGRITEMKAPADQNGVRALTQYSYDADGNLQSLTDHSGDTTTYEYDSRGNQTLVRDAQGNTVEREYDSYNQLSKETVYRRPDPDGDGAEQPAEARVTHYVYDDQQRLRFVIGHDGTVQETRYSDAAQNAEHGIPARTVSAITYLQHGYFDQFDAANYSEASAENIVDFAYSTLISWVQNTQSDIQANSLHNATRRSDTRLDFRGQVYSVTAYSAVGSDGEGIADGSESTQYTVYDANGQLHSTVDPRGGAQDASSYKTSYVYDGLGRLLSSTDAEGHTSTTLYNDAQSQVITTDADGLQITRSYATNGSLISEIRHDTTNGNATLGETRFFYDTLGRIRATQDAIGAISHSLYDDKGQMVAVISASGAITEFHYDGEGQQVQSTHYANRLSGTQLQSLLQKDNDGNVIGIKQSVTLADLRPAAVSGSDRSTYQYYDDAGQVRFFVDGEGYLSETQYNAQGQVLRTTQYGVKIQNPQGETTATLAAKYAASNANLSVTSDSATQWVDPQQSYAQADSLGFNQRSIVNQSGSIDLSQSATTRPAQNPYALSGTTNARVENTQTERVSGSAITTAYTRAPVQLYTYASTAIVAEREIKTDPPRTLTVTTPMVERGPEQNGYTYSTTALKRVEGVEQQSQVVTFSRQHPNVNSTSNYTKLNSGAFTSRTASSDTLSSRFNYWKLNITVTRSDGSLPSGYDGTFSYTTTSRTWGGSVDLTKYYGDNLPAGEYSIKVVAEEYRTPYWYEAEIRQWLQIGSPKAEASYTQTKSYNVGTRIVWGSFRSGNEVFYYRPNSSSNWKSVIATAVDKYTSMVSLDYPDSGDFDFRIDIQNGDKQGGVYEVERRVEGRTPLVGTGDELTIWYINGLDTTDPVSNSSVLQYYSGSLPSNIQSIVAVSKNRATGVSYTASTYPQDIVRDGFSWDGKVNLRIGSALPDGQYDITLTINGVQQPSIYYEIGEQYYVYGSTTVTWPLSAQPEGTAVIFKYRLAGGNDSWTEIAPVASGSDHKATLDVLDNGSYEYLIEYIDGDQVIKSATGTFSVAKDGKTTDSSSPSATFKFASIKYVEVGTASSVSGYFSEGEAASIARADIVVRDKVSGQIIYTGSDYPADYLAWLKAENPNNYTYNGNLNISTDFVHHSFNTSQNISTSDWQIYDSTPAGATLKSVYDSTLNRDVIEISGDGTSNGFRTLQGGQIDAWNITDGTKARAELKLSGEAILYYRLETSKGPAYVSYNSGVQEPYIYFSSSSNTTYYTFPLEDTYRDGNWHTFERDILADVAYLDPAAEVQGIMAFYIRGNGRIGTIEVDTHTPTGKGELGAGRYAVEVTTYDLEGDEIGTNTFDHEIGTQTEHHPTEFRWPVSSRPAGSVAVFEYEVAPNTWQSVPALEDGSDLKVMLGDVDDGSLLEGTYHFRIRYQQNGETVKQTAGSPTLTVSKGATQASSFDFEYTVVSLQSGSGHGISGYPVATGGSPALNKIVAQVKDGNGQLVSTAETYPQLFGNYNGEVNLAIGTALTAGQAYSVTLTLHYDNGSSSAQTPFAVEVGDQAAQDRVISWSEAAYAPQADEVTVFEYRRAGSSDAWASVAVSQSGSDFSVNLGYALTGNYEYRASSYRDADGNGFSDNDRLLRTLSGTFAANDSGPVSADWAVPTYQRSASAGYAIEGYLSAAEATDIAYVEAVVIDNATGSPISAQPAQTWIDPATLHDGSFAGRVNLLVGEPLADGDYSVQVTRHYIDGSSQVDASFQHQIGLQQEAVVNPQLSLGLDEPYTASAVSLSIRPLGSANWETLSLDPATGAVELDKASHANGVYEYQLSYTLDVDGTPVSKSGVGRFTLAAGESYIQALSATASGVDLADARIERRFYDDAGRVSATLDAEGYLTEYRYNRAGQLVSTTQYANRVADYDQSAHWLNSGTLQTLRPAADPATDRSHYWLYDGQGREVAEINAEGYVTEHQYDAAGNRVKSLQYADSLYDLNELNSALAAVDNDPARLSLGSDRGLGQVRPLTSSDDRTTEWRYDARNQVTHSTDAFGNTSTFTYTAGGQLASSRSGIIIASGSILDNYLDNYQGDPTFSANDSEARDYQFEYDVQGRVIAERDHQGRVVLSHSYDDSGRRISSIDANGYTTHFAYSADGLLKYSLAPVFNPGNNALEWQLSSFSHNAFGEVTGTRQYASRLSNTALNNLGLAGDAATLDSLAASLVDDDDTVTSTVYTQRSQVDNSTDGEGFVSTSQYNAFGERTRLSRAIDVANSRQAVTDFSYSRRGELETSSAQLSSGPFSSVGTSTVYNAFGEAVSSTDARGFSTDYAYDRLGQLVTQTNALEQQTHLSYDAFGRVLTRTDALNRSTRYEYDDASRSQVVTTPEGVQTRTVNNIHGETFEVSIKVGDSWLRQVRYDYDTQGNLTDTTDALGNSARSEYNAAGQLTASVDASGVRTELTYDPQGRVLTRTQDVGGLNLTTTQRYGHRYEETVDASGSVTRTEYDKNGRVSRVIVDASSDGSGLNLLTQYRYDGQGNLLQVQEGALSGGIDGSAAIHRTTAYSYDELGRVLSETLDPNGLAITTRYAYDQAGNRTAATNALGYSTYFVYDALGRERFVLTPHSLNGASNMQYAALEKQYDDAGQLVASIGHDGVHTLPASLDIASLTATYSGAVFAPDRTTHYVYNDDGQLTHNIDPLGQVTETVYDSAGRVSAVIRYADRIDPSTESVADLVRDTSKDRETRYQYDAAGRQTHTLRLFEQGGAQYAYVTESLYNSRGEVVGEIAYAHALHLASETTADLNAEAADNRHSTFIYDAAGRRTHTVDSLGYVTETRYDDSNDIETVIRYANGISVPAANGWAGLSAADLAISASSQHDQVIVTQYDAAGRKASLTEKVWADGALQDYVESYQYDALGNRTQISDPLGYKTYFSYDAAGRLTHKQVPRIGTEGYLSTWSYDAQGQVLSETHYSQAVAQNTDPSAINTNALAHAQDRSTHYTYHASGQLKTETDSAGVVTQHDYTTFGETWRTIEAKGLAEQRVTYRGFDQLGRLVEETSGLPDWAQSSIDNRHSLTGSELGADEQVATTYFSYNAFGELETLVSPRGPGYVSQQHHDQLGRKVGETDARGGSTQTVLDAFGNIVATTDPNGNTGVFLYDANNQLTHQVTPDGAVTTYSYDAFGQAVDVRTYAQKLAAGTDIAALNRAGLDTLLSGLQDAVRDRHSVSVYDNRGQLLTSTQYGYDLINGHATANVSTYKYDAAGNRTAMIDARGARTDYLFDAQGRVTQETGPEYYATLTSHKTSTTLVRAITKYNYNAFDKTFEAEGYYWDVSAGEEKASVYGIQDRYLRYDHNGQLLTLLGSAFIGATGNAQSSADFDGTIDTVSMRTVTERRYDALGRLVYEGQRGLQNASLNDDGSASGVQHGQIQASAYSYNRLDQQVFALDTDGGLTYNRHDAAGNLRSESRYDQRLTINGSPWDGSLNGLNLDSSVEHWRTDAQALQGSESSSGRTTHYQYNANNLVTKTESDAGVFFDLNNLVAPDSTSGDQQELQNGFSLGSTQGHQALYDANGNPTIQIDGKDQASFALYDAAGNRVLEVDRLGYVTEYIYDGLGQITAQTRYAGALDFAKLGAPADNEARHAWLDNLYGGNRAALVANVATGDERTTEYVYSGRGLLLEERTKGESFARISNSGTALNVSRVSSDLVTRHDYDGNGLAITTVRYDGDENAADSRMESVDYNVYGQQVQTRGAEYTDYRGQSVRGTVSYRYDLFGNRTAEIVHNDSGGQVTSHHYNMIGKRVETRDARENRGEANYEGKTRFYFDAFGNAVYQSQTQTDIDNAQSQVITWLQYDALGREIARSNNVDQTEQGGLVQYDMAYNTHGQIIGKGINTAVRDSVIDGKYQEYYVYDELGRLFKTNADNGSPRLYLYDQNGNATLEIAAINNNSLDSIHSAQQAMNELTQSETQWKYSLYDQEDQLITVVDAPLDTPSDNPDLDVNWTVDSADSGIKNTVESTPGGAPGTITLGERKKMDMADTWRHIEDSTPQANSPIITTDWVSLSNGMPNSSTVGVNKYQANTVLYNSIKSNTLYLGASPDGAGLSFKVEGEVNLTIPYATPDAPVTVKLSVEGAGEREYVLTESGNYTLYSDPIWTPDNNIETWVSLETGGVTWGGRAAVSAENISVRIPDLQGTTTRDNDIHFVDDQGMGYSSDPGGAIAVDSALSWVDSSYKLTNLMAGDRRLDLREHQDVANLSELLTDSNGYFLAGTTQGSNQGYIEESTTQYYTSRQVTLDSGREITVHTNRIETEERLHIFVPLFSGGVEYGWREVVITTNSHNYAVSSDFLQADDTEAESALDNAQNNPLEVMPSLDWTVNDNILTLESSAVSSIFGDSIQVKVLAKSAGGQVVMDNTQYNWSDGMAIALNSNAAAVSLTFVDPDGLVLHAVDLYSSAADSQSGSVGLPGEGVGLEHLPEVNKFWLSAGYRSSKQGSGESIHLEYSDSVSVREATYEPLEGSVAVAPKVEAYGDVTVTYHHVIANRTGSSNSNGTPYYQYQGEVKFTISGLRDATGAKITIGIGGGSTETKTITKDGTYTITGGYVSSSSSLVDVGVFMTTNGQDWGGYSGSGGVTKTSPELVKVYGLPDGTKSISFIADGVTQNVNVPSGQDWVYVDTSSMNDNATNLAFVLLAYSGSNQTGTTLNHARGNFNNDNGGSVTNITNKVTKITNDITYVREGSSDGTASETIFYSQTGLYNREAIRNIALQLTGAANDETLIAHHATYNAFGENVASIDNNGNTTLYEYDQRGNVVKELKPEADVYTEQMTSFRAHTATEYGVNAFGEVVMEKVGAEAAAGASSATQSAVTSYNAQHEQVRLQDYEAGLLIASQDGEGDYDTQIYDQAGNLKGSSQLVYRANERGNGTSALYYQVAYHYDANNQLVRMNRFQDSSLAIDYGYSTSDRYDEWDYDEFGNRIRHRNALYGDTNHVLDVSFNSSGSVGSSGTVGQETYRYDGMGRVLQYKSYNGKITDYAYAWSDAVSRNVLAATGQQAQGAADQVQLGGYITSIAKSGMGGVVDTDWNQSSHEDVLSDAVDYFGKAVWHDDLGGHRIEYTYNYAGWLSRQTGNTALSGDGTWEARNNQDIRYTYYHNGNLFRTYDYGNNGLSDGDQTGANSDIAPAVTEYRYDKAGNRTGELYYRANDLYNNLGRVVYQHSNAVYDEQGRITSIEGYDEYGNAYQIDYTFDVFGNRRSVSSVYDGRYVDNLDGTIDGKTQSFYYTYDKNNRFTLTLGEFENGQIVLGKTGTAITYNGLDQRYLASRASDGSIREKYAYDSNGRLTTVHIDQGSGFVLRASRVNNDAGQVTAYHEYDSKGKRFSSTDNYYNADGIQLGYQTTRYDENGMATNEVTRSRNTFLGDGQTVNTTVTNAYTEDSTDPTVTTLYNSYEKWDTYKTKSVVISADKKDLLWEQRINWESGEAYYTYDSNGHIRRVYDVEGKRAIAYVTDKEGRTLVREEINDDGQNNLGREMRHFYYFNGHAVGDVGNDQVPSRYDYVKALAQAEGAGNRHLNSNGDHVQAVQSADFDQNYQPINPNYPTASYSSYEAQGGETLQSVAAMVWGDSSLWYLLADANGMKGDEVLTKGQRLELPNVVTNIHNNSDTFRPVDGALQMGDTAPTLPDVPPPPPVDDGGCGALGMILVIVVAVVATVFTAGALAPLVTGVVSSGFAGTMAAGASLLAGGAGFGFAAVGAAFTAGAVGSIASQATAIGLGMQEGFSWSDVAVGGLTTVATMGVGRYLQGFDSLMVSDATRLNWAGSSILGASSAVTSYGINKAFNKDVSFSWRNVATSAVASGVSSGLADGFATPSDGGGALAGVMQGAETFGGDIGRELTSALINESVQSAIWGDSFDWGGVAIATAAGVTQSSIKRLGGDGEPVAGGGLDAGSVTGGEKASAGEQRLTEQFSSSTSNITSSWSGQELVVTASQSGIWGSERDYWSNSAIIQRNTQVMMHSAGFNSRLDAKTAQRSAQVAAQQAYAALSFAEQYQLATPTNTWTDVGLIAPGGTDFSEEVINLGGYISSKETARGQEVLIDEPSIFEYVHEKLEDSVTEFENWLDVYNQPGSISMGGSIDFQILKIAPNFGGMFGLDSNGKFFISSNIEYGTALNSVGFSAGIETNVALANLDYEGYAQEGGEALVTSAEWGIKDEVTKKVLGERVGKLLKGKALDGVIGYENSILQGRDPEGGPLKNIGRADSITVGASVGFTFEDELKSDDKSKNRASNLAPDVDITKQYVPISTSTDETLIGKAIYALAIQTPKNIVKNWTIKDAVKNMVQIDGGEWEWK